MESVTKTDKASMDALQARVREELLAAEADAARITERLNSLAWLPEAARDVVVTPAQRGMLGVVRMQRDAYERWVGQQRGWVLRGYDEDGSHPSVEGWLGVGDAIAGALAEARGGFWEAGNWAVVKNTATATARDTTALATTGAKALGKAAAEVVGAAAEGAGLDKPWPLTWKLAAGALGLAGVALAVGYAVRAVK